MQAPRYRYRLYLLTLLILVGSGVLLSRLYTFQIKRQDEFRELTPSNYTVKIREPGVRGEITDRNGIPLVKNQRNYTVYFNLKEIHKAYIDEYGKELTKVTKIGGKPSTVPDIAGMVRTIIMPYLKEHGLDAPLKDSAMSVHYRTHSGLVPYVFREDLTIDQFAFFAEHNIQLPGVYLDASPTRYYPFGSLAAHVLGYTSPWKKDNVPDGYRHYIGDPYGVQGIERTMNEQLTGGEGIRTVLKSEKGENLGDIDYQRPSSGARVTLTIDAHLQHLTESVLSRAGKGAAIIMDPNTGEILAMASVPNYDPNHFIGGLSQKHSDYYYKNPASPLLNRTISNFAPGSTFKLAAAIAGCKHGHRYMQCNCIGYTSYGTKTKIGCWKKYGHGVLALAESLQRSCNPYFMKMANAVDYEDLAEVYAQLGFGHKTGIKLPHEKEGIVPGSPRWFKETGERMTPAQTGMMGIGQGQCQATPLQLASLVSTIANGGDFHQPRIIRKVTESITNKDITPKLRKPINIIKDGFKKEHLDTIREGMFLAANKTGGTARRASLTEVKIAAKTGTAQTSDNGLKTHVAWTVSFAPYENPRYVVVVAVKRGGSGGKVAGALTKLIYNGIFEKEKGTSLRLVKSKPYPGHQTRIEEIIVPKKEEDLLKATYSKNGTWSKDEPVKPDNQSILIIPHEEDTLP